ncbi:serine/threonine-protein kinase PCRK1-like [Mangifera indica]|uniref:serine/threonine-protein kinase PCRK1-like n=1 Tax=Mangifera indica TaxID=29780 RepID=UPI001CF9EE83|nr:serine/threonine-protein kinase PCRK1-like [Mangifera indica]
MKCFHFTNGDRRDDDDGVVSRASKLSWARSLSVASSNVDTTRRSEFDSDSTRDWSDSNGFYHLLTQRRANDLKVFSFAELKSATRGFSRALLIGEGGFGCVYRGVVTVSDHQQINGGDTKLDVAIKQLNRHGFQGHKEWINEVNFLGVVKHPNLVKLVGYCAEDDERGMQRLLVYELMRNKSLEDHLLARVPAPLPWMTRLKISQDAARGLAYLHEEMDFQLIFRDFKTSNVLLDDDYNAKLSDFGLARQGPPEGLGHVSTSVVGTVGYAAPEYVQTGRLTAKSDVWSFGVVLYELITGRRAVERNLPRSEQKLLDWVRPYVSDSKKFQLIVDSRLDGRYCIKSAQRLASLANKCLMKNPKSRPKMSEVVEILGNIISETSSQDEEAPQPVSEMDDVKEEAEPDTEPESTKLGNNYLKKVFDIREMVNLRNRSSGKLDWRNWTPGLVRTW